MPFTIRRADLTAALATLARIVERRSNILILTHLLIAPAEGEESRLTLKATDLDMECQAILPIAAGAIDAAFAAPAHILHDIVRRLPEKADIVFDADIAAGKVAIRGGRAKFNLNILVAADFPQTPGPQTPCVFPMAADAIAQIFGRPAFAQSRDETRYYLNAVFFARETVDDCETIVSVATDGHRLAWTRRQMMAGAEDMPGVIIPSKACAEIVKLAEAAQPGAIATVAISQARASFAFAAATLTTRLVDGTYPDYARVIPANNSTRIEVSRAALLASVERMAVITSEHGRGIKLTLAKNALRLSVVNPNLGLADEEIEANVDTIPLEIGFNAAYLEQILRAFSGDTILLSLGGANAPAIFADPADATFRVVLMPMRV